MPPEGFAERPAAGLLRGWAWNSDLPEQAVVVEAFDGDAFYSRTTAGAFAPDLRDAGRRAGHCLFEFALPPAVTAEVHVLLDGTADRLRTPPSSDTDPVRDWLDGPGAALRPALVVHRLIHAMLGRPATPLELLRFAPLAATPHGPVRLVREVMADTASGLFTAREVVRQAYRGVLGRDAEETAQDFYGNALASGAPASSMIRNLIETPEFAALHASTWKPDAQKELEQLGRALQAAITTLTAAATVAPAHLAPTPAPPDPAPGA